MHEPLPDSKKKTVRSYLKSAGFYSYQADADEADPVKRWIGREVKRFLHQAHLHLPFLLRLSACPPDMCEERQAELDDDGCEAMDEDDEFAPTADELAAEEEAEPDMMRHAQKWDNFLEFVWLIEKPWEQDDDAYRKQRALEYFNLCAQVNKDLKELKPSMQSWVPHIALFIVPRQIILHGDPARRSADACESFGAVVKKVIKHLTCRRRMTGETTTHSRITKSGNRMTWKQQFRKGYIAQAFQRVCVRERLIHGEENAAYLQRVDHRLKNSGLRSVKVRKVEAELPPTVRALMEADVGNN